MNSLTSHRVCPLFASLLLLTAYATTSHATDPVAKSLGLTPDNNALPAWTNASQDAKQALGNFVRKTHQAVMIIGSPKGGYGTGFVISKKHRLVATNAHVADIKHSAGRIVAITNGTAQPYTVERAWYHPGVRRHLRGRKSLAVRSTNPADGPVDPFSPDLAVLQLSADGPALPSELKFATKKELNSLFAQPVGILGYPGHDYKAWPAVGGEASATYHDGVVSRLADFNLNGGANKADKQFVQYTLATWGGYSGSPVFLPNGHVAAIHNMARYARGRAGDVKSIAHGIRVDCLWELLAHYGLDKKVPLGVDKATLRIKRWLAPDKNAETYRRAFALIGEARYLIHVEKKYANGVAKAAEAIKIAPHIPESYSIRSTGYLQYVFDNHRKIARDQSLKQLGYARNDAEKYIRLVPSDPYGIVALTAVINNTAFLTKERDEFRKVLDMGNRLMGADNLTPHLRSEAHIMRGLGYSNLGNHDQALKEYNAAIRLAPNDPGKWETRADYWYNLGRHDYAESDRRKAQQLRDKMKRRGA